ncbi:OsmC family protein [soil metagenome]
MEVKGSLGKKGYYFLLDTGKRTMFVDEPVEKGGTDLAYNPLELMLSSLASCTSITVQMYAKTKGYPLETIDIKVDGTVEAGTGKLLVACDITLHGPLDEAQRARLLGIANRCPVHRILSPQNDIVTRLV